MALMKQPLSPTLRAAAAIASTSLLALAATGCGLGTSASPAVTSNGLTGVVHGGQAPITGSNIALFVSTPSTTLTSNAAYGNSIAAAYQTTTDATGSFRIPAGSYACPAGSYVYIVSAGGNPGASTAVDNSAIYLVAALGSCANVSATTQVIINEVTTVAAAYALGGFAPAGGAGMTEASLSAATAPAITTSSANAQGFADAFANAANIVNIGGGVPNTTTAGGNGTVPVALINTLGDILQNCVNSTSPASTVCGQLFPAATSPTGVVPVNVWQAALNIARYPAQNVTALYGLTSAQAAFLPTLAAQPNDLSIGIVYTATNLASPLGLGIDKNDNVYVTGSTNANLLEFSGQGALLSPATGWISLVAKTDNIRQVSFDPSGSLWLSDGNSSGQGVYQYQPAGPVKAPTQGTLTAEPYGAAAMDFNNYAIANDKSGNVFVNTYKKTTCSGETATSTTSCLLVELAVGASTAYTPSRTFSGTVIASPGVGGSRSLFYDTNLNNIWYTDIAEGDVSFLTVTPNTTGPVAISKAVQTVNLSSAALATPTSGFGAVSVAVDASGNGYVVVTGSGTTTTTVPAGLFVVSPSSASAISLCGQPQNTACGGLNVPAYNTIDGNGNVFIANTGTGATNSSIVEFSPAINGTTSGSTTLSGFVSGAAGIAPNAAASGFTGNSLYQPANVAVDRSGALWTASTGAGTTNAANLVQILGIAAPTNPQSYAGQYGVKP